MVGVPRFELFPVQSGDMQNNQFFQSVRDVFAKFNSTNRRLISTEKTKKFNNVIIRQSETSRFLAGTPVWLMPQSPCDIQKDGRGAQIRTGDPLVPNQVRYQTALHPDPRITRVFWLFKQAFKITKLELSGYLWKIIPTQIPFHLVRS